MVFILLSSYVETTNVQIRFYTKIFFIFFDWRECLGHYTVNKHLHYYKFIAEKITFIIGKQYELKIKCLIPTNGFISMLLSRNFKLSIL